MLDQAMNHLIAVLADGFACCVDGAIASQNDMRDKREEYQSKVRDAAEQVATAFQERLTDAARQRFEGWVIHPRLGHETLVKEGRATDNELQQAIVDHHKKPSAGNTFALTAALIRLSAIVRVVGPECIMLDAPQRKVIKPRTKKNDGRMSRRVIAISDVPPDLLSTVAKLAPTDKRRDQAIVELHAAARQDRTGIAAKLHALAIRPANDRFIVELAAAAASASGTPLGTIGSATATLPATAQVAAAAQPEVHLPYPQVAGGGEDADQPDSDASGANELPDDGGMLAEEIYSFVRKMRWALKPDGGRMTLTPLSKRTDINHAFATIGHLPIVQARLRAIHNGTEDTLGQVS